MSSCPCKQRAAGMHHTLEIIHRHGEALDFGMLRRHGGKHVARERGDAAFARQVIAEKRHLLDVRGWGHNFVRSILRPDTVCGYGVFTPVEIAGQGLGLVWSQLPRCVVWLVSKMGSFGKNRMSRSSFKTR